MNPYVCGCHERVKEWFSPQDFIGHLVTNAQLLLEYQKSFKGEQILCERMASTCSQAAPRILIRTQITKGG